MPSLETNVLLRWVIADVPEQASRVDELLASGERFLVQDAALIETVYVLERVMLLSRAAVVDVIRTVLSTSAFDLDRTRWTSIVPLYAEHPKLSVTDIYLAVCARESGSTPLFTFDRKLAAQLDGVALM